MVAPPLNSSSDSPAVSPDKRLSWVDVARGLLTICVIGIHAAKTAEKDVALHSASWFLVAGTGRVLQFTVPTFLFISIFLGTRSLLGGSTLKHYFTGRLRSTLWPFLVWSFVIAAYVQWQRPYLHFPQAVFWVWSGQKDYHLYFLRVLLQISLALPILVPLVRRPRGLGLTIALTSLATLTIFLGNRYWWGIRDAASYGFWYFPSIGLGLWLGSHKDTSPLSRYRSVALIVAFLALTNYLPLAIQREARVDVRSWLLPISWWVYSGAAGVALLGFCESWGRDGSRWLRMLREIGRRSLPVYLLHPLPLLALNLVMNKLHWPGLSLRGVPEMVLMLLFSLTTSMAAACVLERLRLSKWLFGR